MNPLQTSLIDATQPNRILSNVYSAKPPKSPLRYPGGKSRAVKQILNLLPINIEHLCSPFIGGGSVELALSANGVKVSAYDAFVPLVDFWQALIADATALEKSVREYYPMQKPAYYQLQKQHINIEDKTESAAVFFALNRCSFSGTTLSGGMSPGHPRFTESAIVRLREFNLRDFNVEHADFKQSIIQHSDDFLYLDPPYCIASNNLYGRKGDHHKNFDHQGLAELLHHHNNWLLSYNDCETVRDLYAEYTFLPASWRYGMNATKQSNEVFILSHGLTKTRKQ